MTIKTPLSISKKITSLFLLLLISYNSFGQCSVNTSSYGSAAASTVTGTTVTISTINYQTEYSTVSGFVAGNTYSLTYSLGGCVTVHSGSNVGPVVAFGPPPVSFTPAVSGTYYISYNTNCTTCGTATTGGTSTVVTTTGTPPPPAPANNECTAATTALVNAGNTCTSTTSGTVAGATASAQTNGCFGTADDDVWYKFQALGTTENISLLSLAGSTGDMYFSVYSGTCASPGTALLCSDPESGSVSGLTIGNWYYIRVFTYTSTTGQNTTWQLCITTPVAATNNECTTATPVTVNVGAACVSQTPGSVIGATASAQANGCFGTADDDVWFSFVAANSTQYIALNSIAGSTTDMYFSVYGGSCAAPGAALLCSDPDNGTVTGLTPGLTYWVRVYTYTSTAAQTTSFNVCITTPAPPGPGDACTQAIPFCTGTTYTFPNNTSQPSLGSNGIYDCLYSTPNPVWYFMEGLTAGNLTLTINQGTTAGAGNLDVDYCLWGPFSSQAAGCAGLALANVLSCSYSGIAVETANIPNVIPGQYYILLLTNYSNSSGVIQFNQTAGPGSTNCAVLCGMSALTAVPGACVPATNLYSVTGQVTFQYPPSTGNLVITSSCGGSTITVPSSGLVSPYSYTLTGLTSNGAACTVTAGFTADPTCTLTTPYTAPASCNACVATATNTGAYCAGATIQLNATGGGTYSWTGPGGFTSTLQNPTRPASTTAMSGVYTVTVVNGGTCTATTTVTVNALPVITAPGPITVCAGVAVVASTFVSVPVGATYTWTNSNAAIGLAASGTGQVPGFTSTNASAAPISGTITVTPTIGTCVGLPITYTITVNPQPTSTFTQPANQCLTGNSFTFTNTGLYGSTYSWTFQNGTPATSTTLNQTVTFSPAGGPYTITHLVTGVGGCTSTTTSTVTIYPMPTVTVTPSSTVCAGIGASLTAAGAATYSWLPITGLSATTGATVTATPATTTTYTVTGTSAAGCVGTATVTITVTPLPVVSIPPLTICNGASGTLTASGATTYTWSPATGLSATTGTSVTANPTVTTVYTVIGTTAGCTGTNTVTVTVNPTPVITAPAPIVVCAGTVIAASAFVSVPAGATYAWTNSNAAIGLAVSGAGQVPSFTGTNLTSAAISGTITVTPTIGTCVGLPITYSITINPQPTSTFTQSPNQCLTGNTFTFTNTGLYGSTYSWTFANGTPVSSTALSPSGITFSPAGGPYTITHVVTGAGGCTSTTTSTVTINPMPTVTVTSSSTVCAGIGTSLTAAGASTYSWLPVTGLSATTGATVTATPAVTTTYTVTGTTAFGCTGTALVTITVNPIPVVSVPPITICAGISGTLTASGAATYAWSPGTGLSATTGTSVTANPAVTTIYTVTGTTAGCSATTTVTVTVNPLPIVSVPPITICAGVPGTLTASGAFSYTWAPGTGLSATTGTSVTATPAATTTYTVTGTSALGCLNTTTVTVTVSPALAISVPPISICASSSGTLTASGATTYTWAPATGLSATTGTTVTANPVGTTTYTVTGTSGSCTGTTTVTVTVAPSLTISCAPIAICAGIPGTLTASGATTYAWAPGTGLSATTGTSVTATPATNTTYTITGTTGSCTGTGTVAVTVNPLPTISCAPITICPGIGGTLTASGAFTYTWAPATGLSATTGTSVTATPAVTTTYTVTGTSASGCVNTTTVIVTVNPTPVISVSPITICTGIGAPLTASGANTYTWAPAAGLSATTGSTVTANPAATTTYTVTGTAATGCIATATVIVTVTPPATLSMAKVNVSCFGGSNGSATVSPVGGTTPYSYSWAPSGGTGATASGLAAGVYTVTVTTFNGCVSTLSTTITEPTGMTLTMGAVTATCGSANGQASVVVSGGSPGYTYSWAASGGTAATATGLSAATYTVTVTDLLGCISTNSVAVNNSGSPTASTTVLSNVSCFGGNNGSVSVTIAGGASPYTQLWSPSGGTGVTASSLTAGTYTVTVTDNVGCIVTANAIITQPPVLTASTVKTNALCFGGSTGTATVTAAGGTPTYTYSWAPSGGTGATANGLAAGVYTCTVTDSKGCITTATATIGQPTVITGVTSNTPVLCFGGTTGTASVIAGGGSPGYTYSWAPSGGTNPTATGLTLGTFVVTITDLNGCIQTANTTISQPTLLTVSSSHVNSSCGFANGTATAVASGGTGVYTYSWAPSGGTTASANGLAAATYTVTVTDANGCTATSSQVVSDLSGLVASITTQVNVSCFGGNNGSVTITASGSSSPYTYSINGGTTYQASGTFGTLSAGSYTVIAKDANGCTVSVAVIITQPAVLTASNVSTNVTCFGGTTGTATVTAVGGTGPYTYAWAPSGGTGFTASSLAAGVYTVTVTDSKLCTTTATSTIIQPTVITGTTSNTPVSCFGGTNGTASVVAGGGSPGYTYSWAPSGGTASTATGLAIGTYIVTITDLNGCTQTASTTLSQPVLLTASSSHTNSSCGFANGTAAVTAAGGTGVYSYSWAPSGGTSASATGLAAATYTVTVTDANGCTATSSQTVSDLSGLVASITTQTNVSCFAGTNGSVTVTASGSTGPYTYSIDGGTTFMASGTFGALAAGSYTVIARDANGCTVSVSVLIIQPTALSAAITAQTNILCNGANTGSVTVLGSGGSSPYSYSTNGVTFGPSGTFATLTAGPYTITVKDNNGCTVTVPVTITQPAALTASNSSQANNICFGGNTASVTIAGSGGTPVYSYSLNGGTAQSSGTFSGMTMGIYTVTVTDGNSCVTTIPVTITQPTQVTVTATKVDASCGAANGSVTATGASGSPTYTYSINGVAFQASPIFTGLVAATYTITVKDVNGCTNTTTITVNDLSGLLAPETHVNVSCNGGSNGSITVIAGGSASPYSYSIDGGITFQPGGTFSGLIQGSYTIITKDGNGCTVSVPVTITQPTPLTGTLVTQTNINCFGGTGSATVSANGGTTAYSYSVDGGIYGASGTFTGLAVGPHTITIQDANNCTTTVAVTITQPAALAITTSSANATCTASNGSATVVASGGTVNYAYLWTPGGATTAVDNNIAAGNYSVLVTDAHGCTQTANVSVGANTGASATISSFTNVTCIGAINGTATVSMGAGSIPPFTYAWSPTPGGGQGTANATGLAPGNYNVTVTDGYGCIGITSATITEPTQLSFSFTTTPVSCFGGTNGTATINPSGGTPGYTYLWTPGGYTTQSVAALAAGTYTCVFTDINGCSKTATTVITQPLGMTLTSTHIDANCSQSNGSATVIVAGGTGPYTYLWTDPGAQTTITATGLAANTIAVTVTDANLCSQVLPVTINNLSGPVATIFASNNVSCFGNNDGSATAVVNGGNNPYQFSWSNGQLLPTATNLTAGTYTLTATDMSGCISSISIAITEPAPLNSTFLFTNPTCFGEANGTVSTTSIGGTAPYTYLWSPGGATTSSISGLLAGTYFCTVTDAHSCTNSFSIVLTNPAQVSATASSYNVTCSGMCNGSATASPITGTGPFTYLWNDPNAQTTATASGLCGGTYTVTATSVNGCSTTAIANITSPSTMAVNITALGNATCNHSCDGFAQAAVVGGSAPYSYLWMPGNTAGGSVNNLCAATYTVTVTDANGCFASTTANITEPAVLTASITSVDITCYNSCDGGATAVYQGGTGPYTFQWTPSLLTTPTIANICAGVQNLAVSDNHGCTAIASVVMIEPTILAVSTTTTNSNCGTADGSACAQITGGSPPFVYAWNDPMTQAVSCANGLNAGVYTISITDGHGCSVTNVANVNDVAAPVVTIPTSTNVTCFGAANGNAQATIAGGTLPYSIDWNPGVQNTAFISNLSGGIYSIVVTDGAGCIGTNSVTINEPAALVSGITGSTDVTCTLSCDGTATVAAGGGTTPYTYLWNDGATQTTTTAVGLCAQQYNVNVTDANGCTSSSIATVVAPTAINIQLVSVNHVSCFGGNNGQITTSVTGGTPGYTYTWTPNIGSSAQVTNLAAGSYLLLVTDANGCTKTIMVDIQQPNAIGITTNIVSSTCGLANGGGSVTVTGGISPYTYFWSPTGTPSSVINMVAAGTYSVTVTDSHNCIVDTTITIQNIVGPTIIGLTFTEPLCNGTSLGTATVIPSGGQPGYTYSWTGVGAQTTNPATALPAGTYQVTVSDANHCPVTGIVTITEPAPLVVVPSPRDTICIGQLAQIYGAGYGGTPTYNYFYTPPMAPPGPPYTVSPLITTLYNVYVTDVNNCFSAPQTISIYVRDSVRVTATDTALCNGSSVPISATATGGTGGPYTYIWSNGITAQSQNVSPTINQSPSNYTVTVSDGCSPVATDISTVTVYPLAVSFMSVLDTAGCEDFTVQFTALSNIGTSYTWNFGDGSASQSGAIVTHTYVTPNSYNVSLTVTTAQGCVSTLTNNQYIDVYPGPTAAFVSNPNQATSTAPVISFVDQSIGATNWAWDFGVLNFGSDTSSTQNPVYAYSDTGSYSVQLIVTNNFGCTDTTIQSVSVIPEYVLYAPNAFTPFNHDGLNDLFMPQGVGIDPNNFEMSIFDRWGNLIFKTNDVYKGWDGKANGGSKIAQADTYVWKIVTKDYKGDNHQYIGRVTLVR